MTHMRLLHGPLMQQGAGGSSTYLDLVTSHGADSYWSMQTARTSGQTISDEIGSADLTATGGDLSLAGSGPWAGSDALVFTEADTESAQSSVNFGLNQDWSLSFWVKMNTTTSTVPILVSVGPSVDYFFLIHRDDRSGLTVQMEASGASTAAVFSDFGSGRNIENDGTWHHIAVTREFSASGLDDYFTCWLDGVQSSRRSRSNIGCEASLVTDVLVFGNRENLDLGGNFHMAHAAWVAGTTWGSTEIAAQAGFTP